MAWLLGLYTPWAVRHQGSHLDHNVLYIKNGTDKGQNALLWKKAVKWLKASFELWTSEWTQHALHCIETNLFPEGWLFLALKAETSGRDPRVRWKDDQERWESHIHKTPQHSPVAWCRTRGHSARPDQRWSHGQAGDRNKVSLTCCFFPRANKIKKERGRLIDSEVFAV